MKQFWKNIQFSKTESKAIVFFVVILVAGFSVKFIKYAFSESSSKQFDYSRFESSFERRTKRISLTQDTLLNDSTSSLTDSVINQGYTMEELVLKKSEDSLRNTDPQKKKSKKEEKLQGKKINLNTAPKEELMLLPGVGESMAEKIILYRLEHKGFKKIEDIMKVKGIGKKKFEKMKEFLTTE